MLGFCRDPFLVELHRLGYTLIPLAEAEVKPLDVYGRQGRELFRLDRLEGLFTAGTAPLPPVSCNVEAGEVKTSKSRTLDSGLGVGIVSDWLGGKHGDVSAKLKSLNKVRFSFKGLLKDRIELGPLDKFLAVAEITRGAPTLTRMLYSDQVYVVTSVLKARAVTLSSTVNEAVKADVAVPSVAGVPLSGKAKVEFVEGAGEQQEFRALEPLVFAAQAVQICFHDGVYKMVQVDRTGMKMMNEDGRAAAPSAETGWLVDEVGSYFPRFAS